MPHLLIIDDEPLILTAFRQAFRAPAYQVSTASTAAEGIERFQADRPDVVIADIQLPDQSGLQLAERLLEIDARVPAILMTGRGSARVAIEASRLGVLEYLEKPLHLPDLRELVQRACEISRLMRVPAVIPDDDASDVPRSDQADVLVGRCPAMRELYRAIGRVAPQHVTVLVRGESGTGKEVVARAIYHYSKRADKPFLAVNCAAIPETLLESELFGHEKGTFTGADKKRIGKFEQCHGGTLFLDEIGDMTMLTQSKVLRVLQDQQFERLGGNEPIRTDVRIIAATNCNLETMIAAGQFRGDLYYRLNVYAIGLPPLRERGEDLPLLVDHFMHRFGRELGKHVTSVSPEALAALGSYGWPGNVRELQSVLKHALLEATGPILLPEHLPAGLRGAGEATGISAVPPQLSEALRQYIRARLSSGGENLYAECIGLVERTLLEEVLRHTQGNQSQAANLLGISRVTVRQKLTSHGLAPRE